MSAIGALSVPETRAEVSVSGAASLSKEDTQLQLGQWYAAYVNVRHEKSVARQLNERRIANFLPTYHSVRRWKDRRKQLELPLFPGYVFVRLPIENRLQVLQVPGVVRFVGFQGKPAPLEEIEIECLRRGIVNGVYAEPCPYLRTGQRVRVKHGPLAGAEGILIRKKDKFRVVLSIDLIQRSVCTEVELSDLE